ncbi:tRNA(adenine(34)) deaminase, chloroplastic isoform X2 [Malania oleifera]|uniref:tRNA(adenine(34)) deaminase, chloroplastic isoform X2 n=1 Tax=Malania oleifera TaxID=397392 RepID=UPI0025AE89EF|nr:tRNA(adenine(34)) deaminase, chloroplastic isoform X2 [Malania oleifera]
MNFILVSAVPSLQSPFFVPISRYYYRFPICNLSRGRYNYEVSRSVKERGVGGRRGRRGKGGLCHVVSEETCGRPRSHCCSHSGAGVDAEAMLSLLTEEVSENRYGVRERNGGSFRKVGVEEREDVVDESYGGKRKMFGSDLLVSSSKCEFESVMIHSGEDENRQREEKEAFSKRQGCQERKKSSSCSSFYSLSSSSDFESEAEAEVEPRGSVAVSSSAYVNDLGRVEDSKFDGEGVEHVWKYKDGTGEDGKVQEQGNFSVRSYPGGSGAGWDFRKKSEKKFTEVITEQPKKSRKDFSGMYSNVSGSHESGSIKVSSSHKDRNEKSNLVVNLDERTRKQNIQMNNQASEQSEPRSKYHQHEEMLEINGSDFETTSTSQKQVNVREEQLAATANVTQETREKHRPKGYSITGLHQSGRNSHLLTFVSEMHDRSSNSNRQSETSKKNQEENAALLLNSDKGSKDQHYQSGQRSTRQIGYGSRFQQSTDIVDIQASDAEKTQSSQRQSDSIMKNTEENLNLAFRLWSESEQQRSQTEKKSIRRTGAKKGSPDASHVSMVHAGNMETGVKALGASEKSQSSQQNHMTSVVKSFDERKEKHNQIDESFLKIGSKKVAQAPMKLSSFHEANQESVKLASQDRVGQIGMEDKDERSSQPIVMPPPSQLVLKCSLPVDPTSDFATKEVSSQASGSSSSALDAHPEGRRLDMQRELLDGTNRGEMLEEPLNFISREDALGSANCQEKSSMQFLGEFVEKLRSEVFTSEIRKEKKFSETNLAYEGKEHKKKDSSQSVSEEFQPKNPESRCASGGYGAKGPSDEVWDVAEQTVQEPSRIEEPEGTAAPRNSIVKKTGRPLWGIIADIVRMRWGSHADIPNSALKSGGRSSSNESVSSEAWFSGHEPDENNDVKMKRERSKPKEHSSFEQLQLGETPTQIQGEGSDAVSSKDKIRHVKADTSTSSSILESCSASKGISSASGDENINWNEDGKSVHGISFGASIAESSSSLSTRHRRRSPVGSDAGITDVSGKGFTEQPVSVRLVEQSGAGGKNGELKQRKLERNKQVLKDRFDEWAEAYKFESEQRKIDEMFMREALLEAKKAADTWEVPVGAVLVHHGKIIARGCNLVEELRDSTAHAEMICIREASNLLRTWRLAETTLYVTLEPCPMCAGAILQARIDSLVWGAPNKLLGADGSWIRLFPHSGEGGNGSEITDKPPAPVHPFHPKMNIRRGVLASECADAMQQFFQLRRRKEKKPNPPPPSSCIPVSHHPSKFISKIHDIFHIMFCL